ncbi:hypothetical protein ACFVGV_07020 [Pseudarthrobacter scleromae]|uniref:hypothetical protein n=1 Tax=Pseudarthrobacter scleromae TaxID=158897 RepID=UPI0036257C8C
MKPLPLESDQDAANYSAYMMKIFRRSEDISSQLESFLQPPEMSALFGDDLRSPHYSVSGYAYSQLVVATGCIAALKQMIVRETDDKILMFASPFGAYALIRNAIDVAAVALWLLEPMSGTLRIKRRLLLGVDEVNKRHALGLAMGHFSKADQRRARMKEVAALAGLGEWNPLREKLPSMTRILGSLERHHTNVVFPWLAVWQLTSGHAHGKMWAQIESNELREVESTKTETGSQYRMTIRYGMLAPALLETMQLLEAAAGRYVYLSRPAT